MRRAAAWLGGLEPLLLLSLVLSVVCLWGFIALTDEVVEKETHAFDRKVVEAMRQRDDPSTPIGPPWFQEFGRDATALGGNGFIILLTVIVTGFLLLSGRRYTALLMVLAVCGGYLISNLLKEIISRPRPDVVPHLSHVTTYSFPSTHATISAVVYLTLATISATAIRRRRLRIYVLGVGVLLSLLTGISRVYLGVHYPTDVLAGWLVGLLWALVCWMVAQGLQRKGLIEPSRRLRKRSLTPRTKGANAGR